MSSLKIYKLFYLWAALYRNAYPEKLTIVTLYIMNT